MKETDFSLNIIKVFPSKETVGLKRLKTYPIKPAAYLTTGFIAFIYVRGATYWLSAVWAKRSKSALSIPKCIIPK